MLTNIVSNLKAENDDLSGFLPLLDGLDALASRIAITRAAEKSIDVQYYIWRGDITGKVLAGELLSAADRGVRVRLLLDDLQISEHDQTLRILDSHPSIEVRMFNPTAQRSFKGLELMSRFSMINRRMHNKCYIADNQFAIIGGRNIGDEYFSAAADVNFSDFDVLTLGPVVPKISNIFDSYWNSQLAIPISALYYDEELDDGALEQLRKRFAEFSTEVNKTPYAQAVKDSEIVNQLRDLQHKKNPIFWANARVVADSPDKFLQYDEVESVHLAPQLNSLMESLDSELLIVSPYFIPGNELTAELAKLAQNGVKVIIITNSLSSNDVGIVHTAYAKYREPLLRSGVEIYEFKPTAPRKKKFKIKLPGSSRASLHAKVFVFNRKTIFVGSMNLDSRSLLLNSELGVVIDSSEFATQFAHSVVADLPSFSYRLFLAKEDGEEIIHWESVDNTGTKIYTSEPEVSIWRRMGLWFMSIFTPEYLL